MKIIKKILLILLLIASVLLGFFSIMSFLNAIVTGIFYNGMDAFFFGWFIAFLIKLGLSVAGIWFSIKKLRNKD